MHAGDQSIVREPDSDFVHWLNNFSRSVGTKLRCRFNPQRKRWVIDERNSQNGLWQNILVWETDDGQYLDLNRDLAVRLQLNAWKYKQLIVSPNDYIRELVEKNDAQIAHREAHVLDETIYAMKQDKAAVRQLHEAFQLAEIQKEKEQWRFVNRDKKLSL